MGDIRTLAQGDKPVIHSGRLKESIVAYYYLFWIQDLCIICKVTQFFPIELSIKFFIATF